MTTLAGAPNRAYSTRRGPLLHDPKLLDAPVATPLIFKFPEGDDTIPSGVTVMSESQISAKLTSVQADIPRGCTGTITIDGRLLHESNDNEGSQGIIPLGDMAAGMGQQASKITVTLTNNTASDRNMRYWVQGFA